ncbi:polysaccharide synthesis [Photobacterium kishitanii]|uniref:capsule biosynthesis GfcC family protein n=1 Tax=Photobacterium kishitanii TaxID=318456 RepID=UPI000D15D319|nr:capsule biosynthesis GfcC family protein [Photobacterium kishitanii]PSW60639.1 polysaccharide synthesis [Photobacterium kishitanii]
MSCSVFTTTARHSIYSALASLCLLASMPTMAQNLITLHANGNSAAAVSLQYAEPVRLAQVVSDSLKLRTVTAAPYWLGSSLTTTTEPATKSALIKQLTQLSQHHSDDVAISHSFANTAQWLQQQIKTQRLAVAIDIDKVRLNQTDNPLLTGNYQLQLANRPTSVTVIGAIEKPQQLDWQPRMAANDYLAQVTPIDIATNSYVTVIQPDGVIQQHSIAYWNNNHADIAPGAIIYLGYQSLFHDYSGLNHDISSMLTNRTL